MAFNPLSVLKPIKKKKPKEFPKTAGEKADEYLSGKELLSAEKLYRRGTVALKDLIAPASFEIKPDYVRLNDLYARTLFVLTYPRYLHVGWFAPIINFSAPLDIAMYFYPLPDPVVLKQLRDKVGNLQADINAALEKGAPRDPARETALKDVEQLRDDITQGLEKFFQFGLYTTIYGKTLAELDELTERLEYIFGSASILTKRALWQSHHGFTSSLPEALDQLQIGFNMNSSPIATSFPFVSSDLSSDAGVLYGINRHNNSLVLFDRFSMPNANSVVFATSGAGKSYFVKLEILRSLMLGTDVIVIDPEREYAYLSDAVGGTYVNISLNSDSRINPFDLPASVPTGATSADIIRTTAIAVKGLLKIMLGSITPKEDSVLDQAILHAYAKKDITPEADLAKTEPPLMGDLVQVLDGMDGAEDLVLKLKKYTEGTFAGLFNQPTNVDPRNQLVVFSVRDLEDELRPMAIYNIINYVWNLVRSELKKRILVIDEAWWLMQYEDSAKFMYALVKRCRKYYLGVTTVTQDVNDFLNSPYGKAIVTNSSMEFLMRQTKAGIDVITDTFKLTEGEKYLLLESSVGEGIFFAGSKHAAMKVVASYVEDQIITTDPAQLLEIERSKQEFAEAMERGEVEVS
ncbi:MAG: Type IV secretory pathway VirB4 component-like protein [Parcubacteria group bacterium GW2011_GWC2_44_17]|uniref:Conjugal transfer protein TraC n=1 Tax=Candidatus Jacksonbacteria bacterium RIFCSPLOWO2_02_FULL_44_20 TaxID=1798460 RepID=A0A1G2A766_9BACT|nr:MAG: Type IV secretory pathway VirB4 component-like protein [Parcubacteria group bacterium GW2011_GWC2_44_17]OGY72728.1 MAG: conjugal transfer protein TraC [Candidatus Jacksonbacteria bacterium RIFCSPLOWO2_02_FULL_44_20]OGY72927.1 MAG: conjugal transfer protein TraC [Candidatus Jacksonbacteria bacterium RIFCSPLOWO2_12_FULL_44_15b]HCE86958.1 conjugal transfer protein TraC [Candidatus Jacksonbacteria bacterium]